MLGLTKPTSIIMIVILLLVIMHGCPEHLPLVSGLSRKLASRFIGSYKMIEKINLASFKLELPPSWSIHPVFHCSQLKKA